MLDKETVLTKLKSVKYPGYNRDIVSFGLIRDIEIEEGRLRIILQLSTRNDAVRNQLIEEVRQATQDLTETVDVVVEQPPEPTPSADPWARRRPIPGIQRVIAVASGKGGVGKSTVAVNLAAALQKIGVSTGLLDCDVYGPTVPIMLGVQGKQVTTRLDRLVPVEAYGIKIMSIGLLVDPEQPVIWRGPMLAKAVEQFLFGVDWGELDVLVVDLPPGTGDAALSLCQLVPLDGGIVVTTPQEAAVGVVRKGIAMFQRVGVPVLGIVENMSYFLAPDGSRVEIFGHGGGRLEAERQGIPFLGEIPIYVEIRESGDKGIPVVESHPESEAARCFLSLAEKVHARLTEPTEGQVEATGKRAE